MDILQQIWGWSLIYSAAMFLVLPMFPETKTKKQALIQLFLSGYIGWSWFLFVELPKHMIKKNKS